MDVLPLLNNFTDEVRILLCCNAGHTYCFVTYFDTFCHVVPNLESIESTLTSTELAHMHAEFPLHVLVE